MTDPRVCRVCPFLNPWESLNLKQVAEYARLDDYFQIHGALPKKFLSTYLRLYHKRYFPPCDLERMGAA